MKISKIHITGKNALKWKHGRQIWIKTALSRIEHVPIENPIYFMNIFSHLQVHVHVDRVYVYREYKEALHMLLSLHVF